MILTRDVKNMGLANADFTYSNTNIQTKRMGISPTYENLKVSEL